MHIKVANFTIWRLLQSRKWVITLYYREACFEVDEYFIGEENEASVELAWVSPRPHVKKRRLAMAFNVKEVVVVL